MEEFILNRNLPADGPSEALARSEAENAAGAEWNPSAKTLLDPASDPATGTAAHAPANSASQANSVCNQPFPNMPFSRLHPPDPSDIGKPMFITWMLHESLPAEGVPPYGAHCIHDAFATVDRYLDEARTGPLYLRQREIAAMVVETVLAYGAQLRHYDLHSYVVMPNHIHLLLTPQVDLTKLTAIVRSVTARRANELLDRPGALFWDAACCEHVVHSGHELDRIQQYIERNPVPVGMAREAADYPFSSATRRRREQSA